MQNQSTACGDTRHLIHLAVGDDTQPDEEARLLDHLETCCDCRSYHAGMVDAMHVLEQVRDEDSVDVPAGAVWAGVSERLASRGSRAANVPQRRRFNGAVAALCACSLTLALATIVQQLPMNSQETAGNDAWAPMSAMNVGLQNDAAVPSGSTMKVLRFQQPDGSIVYVNAANGQVVAPDFFQVTSGDQSLNF
ncbi:hypothetical protein [Fuerstiella marisgermanici]|uniref:Zinc-finger domain-containing protein n=1 Tax=Fuerstiella marisgermanici TaxID=1891926 RepID=A0A1P8WKB5_9PLAN|nr:hypothetical protein [Fuerstiella marisgermanici]APZ94478.1 hypothetical protein Fuma_04110 [Fuerstiella marisgermanici]